jgi:hypothetical protein
MEAEAEAQQVIQLGCVHHPVELLVSLVRCGSHIASHVLELK